jgi:RHS repeat-associated protein
LEQVVSTSSTTIQDIKYNARGQRIEVLYGNNSKTRYSYNEENFRLVNLLTTRNSGADKLQDLTYLYDSVGNIVQITNATEDEHYFNNTVVSATSAFEYDALYRLTEATGRELTSLQLPSNTDFVNNIPVPNTGSNAMQNYTQQYSYDKLGNILQMRSVNQWTRDYYYDTATNRLLKHDEQGQTVYTYDSHGNMLTMPHLTSMVWDYKDELASAGNGTVTSYYNYDPQGDRSRKVVVKPGGIVEERYYVVGYEVYRKYISNSLDKERETVHIMDDRERFVIIDTLTVENGTTLTTPAETVRYQYSNHLGSACLELDSSAAIISYEEYHPFGTTSYRSGRNEVDVSLKRYKYVGKERDEETGLYYYGARYYAAWLCRFVSVDPLQHKYPYYTPYQYAGNKPITYIDLDGLEEAYSFFGEFANKRKKILAQLTTSNSNADLKQPTLELSSIFSQGILDAKAESIVKKNQATGKYVDNFGTTRQSPGKYIDADVRASRGESTWKDIGFGSSRGAVTTRMRNYNTPDVINLKMVSNTIGEVFGPLMDLYTLAEVLQEKENPFALINPISSVMDDWIDENDKRMFQDIIKSGSYNKVKAFVQNCQSCKGNFKDTGFIYVNEDEFIQIMSGEISSETNLADISRNETLGWAVLVRYNSPDFEVIMGFANINKM